MTTTRIILTIILIPFLAHTGYVLWEYGLIGFYMEATKNAATSLVLFDLFVCLLLILEWMKRDAKDQGRNPLVYNLITYVIGVAGPLIYLIRAEPRDQEKPS